MALAACGLQHTDGADASERDTDAASTRAASCWRERAASFTSEPVDGSSTTHDQDSVRGDGRPSTARGAWPEHIGIDDIDEEKPVDAANTSERLGPRASRRLDGYASMIANHVAETNTFSVGSLFLAAALDATGWAGGVPGHYTVTLSIRCADGPVQTLAACVRAQEQVRAWTLARGPSDAARWATGTAMVVTADRSVFVGARAPIYSAIAPIPVRAAVGETRRIRVSLLDDLRMPELWIQDETVLAAREGAVARDTARDISHQSAPKDRGRAQSARADASQRQMVQALVCLKEGQSRIELTATGRHGPQVVADVVLKCGERDDPVVTLLVDEVDECETQTLTAQAESKLLALLNASRAARGLAPVTVDPTLSDVARGHSRGMALDGRVAHHRRGKSLTDRLAEHSMSGGRFLENIGRAEGPIALHELLMRSSAHRIARLSARAQHIGLAVELVRDVPNQAPMLYYTEVLAEVEDTAAAEQGPDPS